MPQNRDARGRFTSGFGSSGSAVKFKDNSALFEMRLSRELESRLRHVGEFIASQVRRNLSIPTRTAGPSEPGEYPHADTGALRASIDYKVGSDSDGEHVKIGTPLLYGAVHEHGVRPFLKRTLAENEAKVKEILTRPMA